MLKMKRADGRLYCFSPPVMIATFVIEVVLMVYTVWRYKLNPLTRVIALILLFLATFQLAEYNVCGGMGVDAASWSRVGYVAITFLPAFGIHLIEQIVKKGWRGLVWLAYGTATLWSVIFLFSQRAFVGHLCAGNYVIFQLSRNYGGMFFMYYYAWLFVGIALCMYFATRATQQVREALLLQAVGYLIFILPTTVVNTLRPTTIEGLPSIMCGFAVLYALLLVFGVIPIMQSHKAHKH